MKQAWVAWECLHTFNPAAIVKDEKVQVIYRAEDNSGEMKIGEHCSRLGLATSDDGVHFEREKAPIFYPAEDSEKSREWDGGCEDPRLVELEDGTYLLTYTQWNRSLPRLAVATSADLRTWVKHGPAFQGEAANQLSKSGAIVTELVSGRLIAKKINGKYLMYWGEGDVYLSTSPDAIHWDNGELVLPKRKGFFDSNLAEGGPSPVFTAKGIWLLYNGKNDYGTLGDKDIAPGTYSVGEAWFDSVSPNRLLFRSEKPIFMPERAYESSGQYSAGTTFAEGLVYFQGKFLMYYGCADSHVGVAALESLPFSD